MNITFLIGNGFDIGIGMHSKFQQFFPMYLERAEGKEAHIKQLAKEIGDDYKTWADFELALGKYTLKFSPETKQIFIEQIRDFEKEFMDYLANLEKDITVDEKYVEKLKRALAEFYKEEIFAPDSSKTLKDFFAAYCGENHIYNFVNFNYTYTLEKILKAIPNALIKKHASSNGERADRIGQVIHVHGKYDSYPIIGVNDVGQIANKELAKDDQFTNRVVKPSLNKLLRQGNDTNATSIINQSRIVCVYGMSLGETDKKWWELLMNWLKEASSRHLLIFDYDENYSTYTQFDWLEKEDEIIGKFAKYGGFSVTTIELLRSRIHIAVHKNIFSMDSL